MNVSDAAEADRLYREWMYDNLIRATKHFDLDIEGPPIFGWLDRSISAPAMQRGRRRWIRVVTEQPMWAHGDAWTGNLDANAIALPFKPRVLDVQEWGDNPRRHVRAEVMTRMPGLPCSPTATPSSDLALPTGWWSQLAEALDHVRGLTSKRVNADQDKVGERVHTVFGADVNLTITRWETVHGDLHWSNLFRDPFGIADWELWGLGPVGTDAATLYLYSLAVPAVADAVYTTSFQCSMARTAGGPSSTSPHASCTAVRSVTIQSSSRHCGSTRQASCVCEEMVSGIDLVIGIGGTSGMRRCLQARTDRHRRPLCGGSAHQRSPTVARSAANPA